MTVNGAPQVPRSGCAAPGARDLLFRYAKLKAGMQLLLWSGQSFDEPDLLPEGSFKAAQARYASVDDVDVPALRRWLQKSRAIQWDYKNIVKRKGKLERVRVSQSKQ